MTTKRLTTMQSAMQKIAENITLDTQGPVLIHFWGHEDDQEMLDAFVLTLQLRNIQIFGILLTPAIVEQLSLKNILTPTLLYGDFPWEDAKTVIDLCKYAPTSLASLFDGEPRMHFVNFMRNLFTRATIPGNAFLQIRLPSDINADENGLSYAQYEKTWLAQVLVDYNQIRDNGYALIKQLSTSNQFTLTTGETYTLTFETSGRVWFLDAGDGDFPAGEIYIAPVENSVNGSFVATRLFWEGVFYENVILEFESGTLVHSSEPQILEDLCDAPGDALRFAEFGLGLNPGHTKAHGLTGCTLFDEKILNTCHIAIGMNTQFGGHNDTPIHIDFIAGDYDLSYK